jgi:tetratricopeptide (TPR) repeat protein
MGGILRHSDFQRSVAVYDHTLRHLAEIADNSSFRRFEVRALAGSTYALRRLGRSAEARQRLDEAFERLRQVKAYPAEKIRPGSEPDEALSALAEYEAGNGNRAGAIEIYRKLLEQTAAYGTKPESNLSEAVELSRLYSSLSALYRQTAEKELASDLERRRRELWSRWDSKLPRNSFVERQLAAASR